MEEIKYFKYHKCGIDNLIKKEHTHNSSVEILHVIKGNGVVMINDRLFPLEDNSIYFIPPMLIHHSAPDNCEEYVRNIVNISSSYMAELSSITGFDKLLSTLFNNVYTVLDKADSKFIDAEFKKLSTDDKGKCSIAVMNILSKLSESKREKHSMDNQVTDIISFINENLSEKISLDIIGKKFHISKYYLCHLFKETTQMSIMTYILSQRISLAKNLIINTDKSISEIAIASGFSCFSYFSRMFKSSESISPREFRNKYKLNR